MVKSERYTCELCDKQYSSASSIWNHRTKFHKVNDNPTDNHTIILDNPSIISSLSAIETVKTYNCKQCNKEFKYFQNRWRHEKICKTKNHEIIQTNNSQIIETQNNNTNNGTINNNNGTINNITINNYGEEDTSYVSDKFMIKLIKTLIKNDSNIKQAIPDLIENIHLNPNHKNNNNMKINNIRSSISNIYKNHKWVYMDKNKMIKNTHDTGVNFTENWADINQHKIPKNAKAKIIDYKKIGSKTHSKEIYDEMIKRIYIYCKNYMEDKNELDD